ncbi:hypothetical protein AOQ84DRAFT_222452 [Glonium stellatum]|uniref:Uncharacterized protein n=1 Tax=Glonium stellatum TaxID=574774 RepID=A0A8E2F099_9PEZI|nr:hypothetical protein AOQ84DRAFT_222452 [Glonium stellatum]
MLGGWLLWVVGDGWSGGGGGGAAAAWQCCLGGLGWFWGWFWVALGALWLVNWRATGGLWWTAGGLLGNAAMAVGGGATQSGLAGLDGRPIMSHPSLNPQYPPSLQVHSQLFLPLLDPRSLLQSLPAFTLASGVLLASASRGNLSSNPPLPTWPVPPPAPDDTFFYRTTCIRVLCDIGRITPAFLNYLCITLVKTDPPLSVHCLPFAPPRRGHISAVPAPDPLGLCLNFTA